MLFDSNKTKRNQNGYRLYDDYASAIASASTGSSTRFTRPSRTAPRPPVAPIAFTNQDDSYEEHDLDYLAAGPRPIDHQSAKPSHNNTRSQIKGTGLSRRRELSTGSLNRSGAVIADNTAKRRKIHRAILPGDSVVPSARAGSQSHTQHLPTAPLSIPINSTVSAHVSNKDANRSLPAAPILVGNPSQDSSFQSDKIQLVLRTQIFPHIKSAVSQYQGALSVKDSNAIGEFVRAHILILHWLTNTNQISDCRSFGKRPQLH